MFLKLEFRKESQDGTFLSVKKPSLFSSVFSFSTLQGFRKKEGNGKVQEEGFTQVLRGVFQQKMITDAFREKRAVLLWQFVIQMENPIRRDSKAFFLTLARSSRGNQISEKNRERKKINNAARANSLLFYALRPCDNLALAFCDIVKTLSCPWPDKTLSQKRVKTWAIFCSFIFFFRGPFFCSSGSFC